MKTYFGNYIGMVISGGDKDPEKRGRCQVFIPHIMPTLYEGWNKEGEDKTIQTVGDNLQNSLSQDEITKLQKMLPWAECAAPIIGSGPSFHFTADGQAKESVMNVGAHAATDSNATDSIPQQFNDVAGDASIVTANSDIWTNGTLDPDLVKYKSTILSTKGKTRLPVIQAANEVFKYAKSQGVTMGVISGSDQHNTKGKNGESYPSPNHGGAWAKAGESLDIKPVNGWNKNDQMSQVREYAKVAIKYGANRIGVPYNSSSLHIQTAYSREAGGSGYATGGSSGRGASTWSYGHSGPDAEIESALAAAGTPHYGTGLKTNPSTAALSAAPNGYVGLNAKQEVGDKVEPTKYASDSDQLSVNSDGTVDRQQLYNYILKYTKNSPIFNQPGKIPGRVSSDYVYYNKGNGKYYGAGHTEPGATSSWAGFKNYNGSYGVDGTPQSWANFFVKLSYHESGRKANSPTVYGSEPGGSGGLFQMGANQVTGWSNKYPDIAARYGFTKGQVVSDKEISSNASLNTRAVLMVSEGLLRDNYVFENGVFGDSGIGLGRTIGPLSWLKIATNAYNKESSVIDPETGEMFADVKNQPVIKNPGVTLTKQGAGTDTAASTDTTPQPLGATMGPDTNYQATGMFGYAREGQMVWCFFQEGNPLFPVYFAASYGQQEWDNMAQRMSPGMMEPGFDATVVNLQSGGIRSARTVSGENQQGLGDDFVFELYHKFGHNLSFGMDCVQLNSKYTFRQQTEGDHHSIVLANRETRTMGDDNRVVGQTQYITIGNWSQDALDAADEMQQLISEAMKIRDENMK